MFYERLRTVCKENNTSVSKMLKDLNLSTGSTGHWKKGMLPKGEVLIQIAEYLFSAILKILSIWKLKNSLRKKRQYNDV